jgi:hypothetical protein
VGGRSPHGRREREVLRDLTGIAVADGMPVVSDHAAPAPQRPAAALLRHLQTDRLELPGGGEGSLTGAWLRSGGLRCVIPRSAATVRRGSTTSRRVRVGIFGEDLLQLPGIYAGSLEGTAPAAVREGEHRGPAYVIRGDDAASLPGSQSPGSLRGHEIAA